MKKFTSLLLSLLSFTAVHAVIPSIVNGTASPLEYRIDFSGGFFGKCKPFVGVLAPEEQKGYISGSDFCTPTIKYKKVGDTEWQTRYNPHKLFVVIALKDGSLLGESLRTDKGGYFVTFDTDGRYIARNFKSQNAVGMLKEAYLQREQQKALEQRQGRYFK